jgi:hypothetical protein
MHSFHVIHVHELHGGAPLRRQSMQSSILVQGEVISPRMASGMEQRNDGAVYRIYRCDIGAFLQIAANAAQTKVVRIVWPMVLTGDDVVDLMG